jgi:hypothetical protein
MSEEDWELEYPESSFGWKINRRLDAIEEHALKSGAVFMLLFAVFFVPAIVEIAFYVSTIPKRSPFFDWLRFAMGMNYNLAGYYMVVYVVTLLMFAGAFFYFGAPLLWRGVRGRS